MAKSELGEAIKNLRRAMGGISQERFARRLGTTVRTVARWEASDNLSPAILSRLHRMARDVADWGLYDFFEERLRQDLGWFDGENLDEEEGLPRTPEETDLTRALLRRYRQEDPAAEPIVEQLRRWNAEEEIKRVNAMKVWEEEKAKPTFREKLFAPKRGRDPERAAKTKSSAKNQLQPDKKEKK